MSTKGKRRRRCSHEDAKAEDVDSRDGRGESEETEEEGGGASEHDCGRSEVGKVRKSGVKSGRTSVGS